MWKQIPSEDFERDIKRYAKKHPRELKAVLDNLEKYFLSLQAGIKPLQIKAGFIHPEPQGVVAIDQKGGGKSLAQTRLYVFPDLDTETLFLIALGDKSSQSSDIQACRDFVTELLKRKAADEKNEKESP